MLALPAPVVASMGDPAGVGPELLARCWAMREQWRIPPFFVVGDVDLMAQAGGGLPVRVISRPDDAAACFAEALPVLPLARSCRWTPGNPAPEGATAALESLGMATGLARSGEAAALVTAPIAKARLAEVGFDFPGQTEFVADACGVSAEDAVMLLAGDQLKVVPLTVHVALAAVPGLLSTELIVNRCRIAAQGMARNFGIAAPRLALAALNPHAGEDGRFGDEDQRIVAPAIAELRAEGIDASGPHPADTLFHAEARARYDVALAMYHDQALIPIKTLDFDNAVNFTLGLPIVRASPDHGTAFDIAGKGLARATSMAAALRMAADAAQMRWLEA